jgi:REP element-mobilizing transposase RayT
MKNRDNKIFAPNNYYHIYNRGNGKQDIFLDREDYLFFLSRFTEGLFPPPEGAPRGSGGYHRKLLPAGSFSMVSYSSMPNHFHWLIRQNALVNLNLLLLKICTAYAIYFNKKYKHVGHVFQDRFKAVNIESESYLLWLSAYIHQNPKVAGLVDNPEDWEYSSYSEYLENKNDGLCDKSVILDHFKSVDEYKKFVDESFFKIKDRKDLSNLLLD